MTAPRASVAMLRAVPIFKALSDEELESILDAPANDIVTYQPPETIIEEDGEGDCMYIILDGVVDVKIRAVGGQEITIATLKQGEFFGEQALLPGSSGRRNATVRALKPCRLLRISRHHAELGVNQSEADGAAEDGDLTPPPPLEGAFATEEQRISQLLRGVRLFRALSLNDLARVSEWSDIVEYRAGQMIIREGEVGEHMYVVLEGTADVFVTDEDGKVLVLASLTQGHYFGEQALIPDSRGRRNANVRANGPVTLVRVAKRYFQLILNRDKKLRLALRAVGSMQQKKIVEATGRSDLGDL